MSSAPPSRPWHEIPKRNGEGYLSIYYSDDLSALPVRFVTKPGDNKSDPNLETLTYGLFSTCSPSMRSGLVKRNAQYIFFATLRSGRRVLAGFYNVRWYAVANSPRKNDYYLAAESAHFVQNAPSLAQVDRACGTKTNRRFRTTLRLDATECARIRRYLKRFPNALGSYLAEIDRLERFSLSRCGYRYPSWKRKDKFDWSAAAPHLATPKKVKTKVVNASPSGQWRCSACPAITINKALLRQCPNCGAIATLRPA